MFECLDKQVEIGGKLKPVRIDGFSDRDDNVLKVPDELFFLETERTIDLSEVYGTPKKRKEKVRGLIDILSSYKFTIAENTPIEEEVALDPELLGKVFENLLANYNPETQTTARKQTGSFYTPREIVNYMVDESLIAYLNSSLTQESTLSIPAQGSSSATLSQESTLSIPAQGSSSATLSQESTLSIPAQGSSSQDDFDTFFNPNNEIHIHRGNLPHWQQDNVWYFVTFSLADSIPAEVLASIKSERELWKKKNKKDSQGKYSIEQVKEYYRLFSERIEHLLNDCRGSCVLKQPHIAAIVKGALLHFNNQRYVLDEWVIMPNHVHILVKPLGKNKLPDILHSWKSFTANEINKITGNKGQFWLHESYDHIVRNEKALNAIRNYIRQNPVKANLSEGSFLASWQTHSTLSIPAQGSSNTGSTLSIPPQGTSNTGSTLSIPAQGTSNTGSTLSIPAQGTSNTGSTLSIPAQGTSNTGSTLSIPAQGTSNTGSTLSIPAQGTSNTGSKDASGTIETRLRDLLSYSDNPNPFGKKETEKIIQAVDNIKILDPACGSGAFPMGILHKLVHVLHKLDPGNELWKQRQIDKASAIDDLPSREAAIEAIEEAFENNELDYGRKLYLIENCIYGVDIQAIAVQITKLRFFISLIVEQRTNPKKENLGVRPLPNLETKFVAANTLIGLEKENDNLFTNPEIENKKEQLKKVRHDYFEARTPKRKAMCREKDKQLRDELAELLVTNHDLQPETAKKIAEWNPYDQNASAPFFDMEWMFGLNGGFDVVIGNPPYKVVSANDKYIQYYKLSYRCCAGGKINLYKLFIERGLQLLLELGTLSYITPFNYLSSGDSVILREILLKETTIKEIIDYEETKKVFESVTQAVATIVTSKFKSQSYSFNYLKLGITYPLQSNVIILNSDFLIKGNNIAIGKIRKHKLTFNDLVFGYQGEINVSTKKQFFINTKKSFYLPLVRGNQIGMYQLISKSQEYCPTNISSRDHHKYRRIVFQEVANAGLARRVKGIILEKILCGHTTNYIMPKKENQSIEALLGLVNSNLVNFYFKFYNQTNHVPIGEFKKIPVADKFHEQSGKLLPIVKYILQLKEKYQDSTFFERLIDAMVYELYFPDEIQKAKCEVLKHLNNLPELKEGEEKKNLKTIEKVYKELSDPKHPVSIAMQKMQEVEEVKIIEGRI